MEYYLIAILTFIASLAIIVWLGKKSFKIKQDKYRQSDMHLILKLFFSRQIHDSEKQSQMKKRTEENVVKVINVDDKAYWVIDNVFYVADVVNNNPDPSTARPVDTSNMSKDDIEKMLFILDNLGKGKTENDSSGTGNE
jgi:hypothetical protein